MSDEIGGKVLRGDTDILNWTTRYKRRYSWAMIKIDSPEMWPSICVQHWNDGIAFILGGKDSHEFRLYRTDGSAGRVGKMLTHYQETGEIVDEFGHRWTFEEIRMVNQIRNNEWTYPDNPTLLKYTQDEAIQMVLDGWRVEKAEPGEKCTLHIVPPPKPTAPPRKRRKK